MAALRWFTNDRDLAELSDDQVGFLEAVDALLVRLAPPGASRSRSYWSAEPRARDAGRESHTLWICIAAAATKVESLQIGYAGDWFVGGWNDPYYVWDHPTVLLEREMRPNESKVDVFAEILTWIEEQLRRPALLARGYFGRKWKHADELERPKQGPAAGFFDSPPSA